MSSKDTLPPPSFPMPPPTRGASSSLLSRVQAFLPQIAEANAKLEERLQAGQGEDVRIDTSLQEEDAAEKDEEDENEKKPQQPVISMNLALGPVDETLAEALEGGEGGEGGQQLTAPVEEEEEEEGKGREDDSRTRVVVSLLGVGKEEEGKREGNKEKKEEKEEEGKAKVSKKALIQELS